MRALCILAAATLLLAGCLDDGSNNGEPELPSPQPAPAEAAVVVAVIDTGTNPYHEHFHRPGGVPQSVLDRIAAHGEAPVPVALSATGDFDERMDADADVWDAMEPGVLYTFADTNLLGISFGSQVPVIDDGGSSHGTATTGAVLDGNPDAVIVLVEGTSAAAEAWVAAQPWIDVVSMSYGPPGSVPGSGPLVFGLDTHTNTRAMADAGMLPVGAADNTPAPAPNDETAGPPWVVGVAGDHPETECREHISALLPDFTADFTQTLPRAYSVDEYGETSGTSFSTPMTAGTFSRVLLDVRTAWNHTGGITDGALAVAPDGTPLTAWDLREAVQRTAYYFGTGCASGTPVNPAAPWAQQGWGHVGPEIVNATVAHIIGMEEAPPKDAAVQAFMGAQMQYREALWGSVLP